MKQETVAGKILVELLEEGIVSEEHELIVYNYLLQAYSAGHDAGRQLRTHSKTVAQYSLNGDLLKIFNSVQDAVRATGINKSNIANCARGRKGCATSGGFRWQYVNTKTPTASEEQTVGSFQSKLAPPK